MALEVINIINLPKRADRRAQVTEQMELVNATYVFWEGKLGQDAKRNIHKSFKAVVQMYKNQTLPHCIIAEDDLVWTHPASWNYYLENMPTNADVYTGSYYSGEHNAKFEVKGFRGNTLITIFERYYDRFLSLSEDDHLDGAISRSGAKIITTYPFVCTQRPGYSDQRKRMADDSSRLKGKLLFGQ